MKKLVYSVFLSVMLLSSFSSYSIAADILEYFRIGFVPIEDKNFTQMEKALTNRVSADISWKEVSTI